MDTIPAPPPIPKPGTTCVDVEWRIAEAPVGYADALLQMEARVAAIHDGSAGELVWLLEHPPIYTAGVSAAPDELLAPARFPVHRTGRGGRYTYHGPGQRVGYAMMDLRRRGQDVRAYVHGLEDWVIGALGEFGVTGERRTGRIGIWVVLPNGEEAKIAAIGVRVRRWIAFHGIALNVAPDLSHFEGIVPCGLAGYGVTSLEALGVTASMDAVDAALKRAFECVFAQTIR
jgi:lipoyl(octanoyl) transferase